MQPVDINSLVKQNVDQLKKSPQRTHRVLRRAMEERHRVMSPGERSVLRAGSIVPGGIAFEAVVGPCIFVGAVGLAESGEIIEARAEHFSADLHKAEVAALLRKGKMTSEKTKVFFAGLNQVVDPKVLRTSANALVEGAQDYGLDELQLSWSTKDTPVITDQRSNQQISDLGGSPKDKGEDPVYPREITFLVAGSQFALMSSLMRIDLDTRHNQPLHTHIFWANNTTEKL